MSDTPYSAGNWSVLAVALLAHCALTSVRGTAQSGSEVVQPLMQFGSTPNPRAQFATQFGITWTFATDMEVGRFANGDWWVVGPVSIVKIDPACTTTAGRTINGSMINPRAGSNTQGFDSAMYGEYGPGLYNATMNVALNVSVASPLILQPGKTLVSTISVPAARAMPQIQTAALLTCVASVPASGSFRPPYVAGDKSIRFNAAQLKYSLLGHLTPVQSTPSLASVERDFERPWIDHAAGWLARYMHPLDNMPDYGRDMSSEVGVAALMLHLNFTDDQKKTLLVRFVQYGIDLQGIIDAGARSCWEPNGGHGSGRKWPILFAGLVLGDSKMSGIGSNTSVRFGEDGQTFFVAETSPGRFNYGYGGYTAQDVGMPEWGFQHSIDPSKDNKQWSADSYRICCTANCWGGFVLAARIMGQQSAWKNDSLFQYMDRYLQIETIAWRRFWDAGFTSNMWNTYRPRFN